MTEPARDLPAGRRPASRLLPSAPQSRLALALLLAVLVAGAAAILLSGSSQPSIAGSPPLPPTYRPGSGIGVISLGESRSDVLARLGRPGGPLVAGSLVFARPDGQLAVGFAGDRAVRILATGAGNPFGQRLAAEETTLSGWTVELCEKPPRVLLVAPGRRTYFVYANAAAGLAAVGVSSSAVNPCGSLG
jgi:hypothetical protein